ncbi:hypothetical protein EsH8_VII_000085 [Colletotrichum jinshuiense]
MASWWDTVLIQDQPRVAAHVPAGASWDVNVENPTGDHLENFLTSVWGDEDWLPCKWRYRRARNISKGVLEQLVVATRLWLQHQPHISLSNLWHEAPHVDQCGTFVRAIRCREPGTPALLNIDNATRAQKIHLGLLPKCRLAGSDLPGAGSFMLQRKDAVTAGRVNMASRYRSASDSRGQSANTTDGASNDNTRDGDTSRAWSKPEDAFQAALQDALRLDASGHGATKGPLHTSSSKRGSLANPAVLPQAAARKQMPAAAKGDAVAATATATQTAGAGGAKGTIGRIRNDGVAGTPLKFKKDFDLR